MSQVCSAPHGHQTHLHYTEPHNGAYRDWNLHSANILSKGTKISYEEGMCAKNVLPKVRIR